MEEYPGIRFDSVRSLRALAVAYRAEEQKVDAHEEVGERPLIKEVADDE